MCTNVHLYHAWQISMFYKTQLALIWFQVLSKAVHYVNFLLLKCTCATLWFKGIQVSFSIARDIWIEGNPIFLANLCWDAHIKQLIKKCNSYLFLVSRIKVFLSRRNRILFYNFYILTHLDFCCIIWGNCSSTLEDKLVKFQKRAAWIILDCDLYTPSSELFKELSWQTFPERVTYQKAILMYSIINNICPDY